MQRSLKCVLSIVAAVLVFTCSVQAEYPVGDVNLDCKVDLLDVKELTDYWLDPGCSAPACKADLDGAAGVTISDYAILAGNWMAQGCTPSAPTGLTASAGLENVSLDWNDNTEDDLAGYTVYRSTTSGSGYSAIFWGLTTSNYVDNNVTGGTPYYYVVTASNTGNNESDYSNEDSATPGAFPAGSTYYLFSAYEGNYIAVDESNNLLYANATAVLPSGKFIVESGGGSYIKLKASNGKYVRARDDLPCDATVTSGGDEILWLPIPDSTDPHLGLLQSKVFGHMRVDMTEPDRHIDNRGGTGDWSQIIWALVEGPELTPPAAPGYWTPFELHAVPGDGSISLDWADSPEADMAYYNVYRSTTQGTGHTLLATNVLTSGYVDNTASNGTPYYYLVSSVDSDGNESNGSREASATPASNAVNPSALYGTVLRKVWYGSYTGPDALESDPDYPDNPDYTEYVSSISTPAGWGTNYGQQLSGYIYATEPSFYQFQQVGSKVRFYISSDDDPANKEQKTNPMPRLRDRKKLYFEFLKTAQSTDDGCQMQWRQIDQGDMIDLTLIDHRWIMPPNCNAQPVPYGLSINVFPDTTYTSGSEGLIAGSLNMEGETFTAAKVSDPGHGVASVTSGGQCTYTPTGGYTGPDSFTYKLNDGFKDSSTATVSIQVRDYNPDADFDSWSYSAGQPVNLVTVAEMAGYYVCADRVSDTIEIRDIREDITHLITAADIAVVAPGVDLSGDNYGISSVAVSPSGRLVFIGLCGNPAGAHDDAILQYNTNTKVLRLFTTLSIADSLTTGSNYGMSYYCSLLYVGTANGLYVYDARRNVKRTSTPVEILVPSAGSTAIVGLALDMSEETIYAATPDTLYRMDIATPYELFDSDDFSATGVRYYPNVPKQLQTIATGSNFNSLTVGRSYGGPGNAGLYVQERISSSQSRIHFVRLAELRESQTVGGQTIGLSAYTTIDADLCGISATPCGRMLLATSTPQIMSDTTDTHLDFESWIVEYFNDTITMEKESLNADGSMFSKRVSKRAEHSVWADNNDYRSGGQLNSWLLFYEVTDDPDIMQIIETVLSTRIDEEEVKAFGGTSSGSLKGWLYGMASCKEKFSGNPTIVSKAELGLSRFYRMGDLGSGLGTMDEHLENYGPGGTFQFYDSEIDACSDFAAAQDPYWTIEYEQGLRYPDLVAAQPRPQWQGYQVEQPQYIVDGEECIRGDRKFYQWAFHWITQKHYFTDPEWKQQFYNHVYKYCAWGDDNRNPYLSCFNWGVVPDIDGNGQNNDNNVAGVFEPSWLETSFIEVIDHWCAMGDTWPAVGLYLAYRENRSIRRGAGYGWEGTYYDGISQFMRFNRFFPDWVPNSTSDDIGVPAFAELIEPGSVLNSGYVHEFYREGVEVGSEGGKVKLLFSEVTPRRVLGSDDGGATWTSYGFQYSPFVLDTGVSHGQYKVEDPEGQHLMMVMNNVDFEDNLTGWSSSGTGYDFLATTEPGVSISGTSAEIHTDAGTSGADGSLLQTVDLTEDFEDTIYIVRANGYVGNATAPGRGWLRVMWDTDTNPDNGVVSTEDSSQMDSATRRVEFRIDTQKPSSTAHYLHFKLMVETVSAAEGRYLFDNVSLIRIGAPMAIGNINFETGDASGWTVENSSGMLSLTSDPSKVYEGTYALRILSNSGDNGSTATLSFEFDTTGHATGTRFMQHIHAKTFNLENTTVQLKSYQWRTDKTSWQKFHDYGAYIAEPTDNWARHVAAIPQEPNQTTIKIEIIVDRFGTGSSVDELIIDDLNFYKEPMWPLPDNFVGL